MIDPILADEIEELNARDPEHQHPEDLMAIIMRGMDRLMEESEIDCDDPANWDLRD